MGDADAIEAAAAAMSGIAAAGNIILFASQIPLVWRLVTVDRDSARYDWLPSLTLLTTMSLWCGYTVWVLPTPQLYAANFTGIALPVTYLLAFAAYEKAPARRARILASTAAALAVTWGFSAGIYTGGGGGGGIANATLIGGGVTAAVNCSFFVSPLRQLARAWREADLSRTPTLLSIVQFWQSLAWIVAAALLEDWFILGVNAAGFVMACVQLGVIFRVRVLKARAGGGGGGSGAAGAAAGKVAPGDAGAAVATAAPAVLALTENGAGAGVTGGDGGGGAKAAGGAGGEGGEAV
jgi:hypothetical protein